MADYRLRCAECGRIYEEDSGFRLLCDGEASGEHRPALLVCEYQREQISLKPEMPGVFEYGDWLPVGDYYLKPDGLEFGKPYTYRSERLADRLGLKNLFIAFSGYWPKRNVRLLTRSFKEFEAQASLARYLACNRAASPPPFIVASAGNTANGYNLACHLLKLPLYLVIPEGGMSKLLLPVQAESTIIAVKGDYLDAIQVADEIAQKTGLRRDGGARNVARRAALGTVMLNAVVNPEQGSQRLFDHYFQAVGSATGAIAVSEMVELLLKDGRFGKVRTRIHLVQNSPFTPIPDAWARGDQSMPPLEGDLWRERVNSVTAQVLTTRKPPYAVAGGIYDMLKSTEGMAWKVNNFDVFQSVRMFREAEGVDIGPAAAVAVGALRQAVEGGAVKTDEQILLHVTGGGKEIQYSDGPVYEPKPAVTIRPDEIGKAIDVIGEPEMIQEPLSYLKEIEIK